jgi:protein-tyrosine phosphatase
MRQQVYWVDGLWPGKLAVAARPRGGDWLRDEIAVWKRLGINTVLSLLMPDEEKELDLRDEGNEAKAQELEFISLPIPDRQVPSSEVKLAQTLERVNDTLASGKNVVVHCRQGIGRSGLVAICLLVRNGMSPGAAVESVSAARGTPVPETAEQRDWIERHALALASTK